jgi:uncharacterized membrane protein YqiK
MELSLEGFLDLKEKAPELFKINFISPANPVIWEEGIPVLGIESSRALLSYTGISRPHPDKEGVLVTLDMDFSSVEIKTRKKDEIISKILEETVQDINEFLVTAELYITKEGIKSIKVNSDLDEILKERLGDLLKDLPNQGLNELENYLRKMLEEKLTGSDAINKALQALNIESLSQIQSLEDLEESIKKVQNQAQGQAEVLLKELEGKARAEAEKLKAEADRIKAEAEQKAKEAEAEAQQKKLEAEAAAKAEADRLKKEAEEKARLEAEKLQSQTSKIKVPGF